MFLVVLKWATDDISCCAVMAVGRLDKSIFKPVRLVMAVFWRLWLDNPVSCGFGNWQLNLFLEGACGSPERVSQFEDEPFTPGMGFT